MNVRELRRKRAKESATAIYCRCTHSDLEHTRGTDACTHLLYFRGRRQTCPCLKFVDGAVPAFNPVLPLPLVPQVLAKLQPITRREDVRTQPMTARLTEPSTASTQPVAPAALTAPVGRPRKPLDLAEADRLHAAGMPWNQVAARLGVTRQTLLNRRGEKTHMTPTETVTAKSPDRLKCPECDFVAKAYQGLGPHIAGKHRGIAMGAAVHRNKHLSGNGFHVARSKAATAATGRWRPAPGACSHCKRAPGQGHSPKCRVLKQTTTYERVRSRARIPVTVALAHSRAAVRPTMEYTVVERPPTVVRRDTAWIRLVEAVEQTAKNGKAVEFDSTTLKHGHSMAGTLRITLARRGYAFHYRTKNAKTIIAWADRRGGGR